MLIRPHSDPSLYVPGGKFEPTAANFPSCKFFLPCSETSGTVLTDVIGGSVLNLVNAGSPEDGMHILLNGANTGLSLGRSIVVGNSPWMFIVTAGNAAIAATVAMLNADSTEYISAATTGNVVDDGPTGHAVGTTLAALQTHAILGQAGSANTIVGHRTTDTTYTAGTPVVATPNSIADLTKITLTASIMNLFGVALFVFSGSFPSSKLLQDTITWTHWNWSNKTSKGLYPGLKGIA